jgi:hypothetical protein
MSQWTHVAGIVRVDALQFLPLGSEGNPDLEQKLGPMCLYNSWDERSTLPRGSEGSLEYAIHTADQNALAAYTVAIWGDLRDFNSIDAIEAWLNTTFGSLLIRNAVVQVEVEQGPTVVLAFDEEAKAFKRVASEPVAA